MTNLHDARVAAFKAEWEKADAEGDAGNRVSRGLAAADAVVTVEMIAEVARTSFNRWWNSEVPEFGECLAKDILALLRGGEER